MRIPEHAANTFTGDVVLSSPRRMQASFVLFILCIRDTRSMSFALSYFVVLFFTSDRDRLA